MSVSGRRGIMSSGPSIGAMPYDPPFTTSELLVIEDAIVAAWTRLRDQRDGDTGEVKITEGLVAELNRLMNDDDEPVPGFSSDSFETLVRGGELRNYLGTRLETRPDLVFRRVGRYPGVQKQFWGLFVECKCIDRRKPVARYCQDGLLRFVDGDYAWAVSMSMMLGYATEGYLLPGALHKHFERKGTGCYGQRSKRLVQRDDSQIWESVHDRNWSYPDASGRPGPITILHLWLTLPSAS